MESFETTQDLIDALAKYPADTLIGGQIGEQEFSIDSLCADDEQGVVNIQLSEV